MDEPSFAHGQLVAARLKPFREGTAAPACGFAPGWL